MSRATARSPVTHLELDSELRRSNGGRTLLGGSPIRLIRVTDVGARLIDRWGRGEAVSSDRSAQRLARRLLRSGMAHPQWPLLDPAPVTVVVPHRNDIDGLQRLLPVLKADDAIEAVIVIDDGSDESALVLDVAASHGAAVATHDTSAGPGAARNTGWRSVASDADIVVFVDADVVPEVGWLAPLLAHFADDTVGVVAPRVRSQPGSTVLDRFEAHRSPLDLGDEPARVLAGSRVSYVPAATLAVRADVLRDLVGFAPTLRVGEDVDFVWRAIDAGWGVRYEPGSVVRHRNRRSWSALYRQRRAYGSSAAELDRRHPGAVAPVDLDVKTAAAWVLAVFGGRWGRLGGSSVALASTVGLVPDLRGRVDDPVAEAVRLGALGHLAAGRFLAAGVRRSWLPGAVIGGLLSKRLRRATLAAAIIPPAIEWIVDRPAVDPVRWIIARNFDDASYCIGAWEGAIAARSPKALLPRLRGIPHFSR